MPWARAKRDATLHVRRRRAVGHRGRIDVVEPRVIEQAGRGVARAARQHQPPRSATRRVSTMPTRPGPRSSRCVELDDDDEDVERVRAPQERGRRRADGHQPASPQEAAPVHPVATVRARPVLHARGPYRRGDEPVPDHVLLHLARRGAGQVLDEHPSAGHLEGRQAMSEERFQLARLRPAAPRRGRSRATAASPHRSSGTPTTAAWATSGCSRSAFSISTGKMFSPPDTIISLSRPVIRR